MGDFRFRLIFRPEDTLNSSYSGELVRFTIAADFQEAFDIGQILESQMVQIGFSLSSVEYFLE